MSSKNFSVEADHFYYFVQNESELTRKRLASITVYPRSSDCNLERAVLAARVAFSFVYEVVLRPVRRVFLDDHTYRQSFFPTSAFKKEEREFHNRPISAPEERAFLSKLIRYLYKSSHNLEYIEHSVHRYIAAVRDLPIENAFSAGCEAIESLYGAFNERRSSSSQFSSEIKEMQRIIKTSAASSSIKQVALSKLSGVFDPPAWNKIYQAILDLYKCDSNALLEGASFFKYRNLSSHGRLVRANSEVMRQFSLMKLAFQMPTFRDDRLSRGMPT